MNRFLTPKLPDPINFEDEITDEKIESIDDLIKDVIEQRKFEIKPQQNSLSLSNENNLENRINLIEEKIEKIMTIINTLIENKQPNESLFEINDFNSKDDQSDTNSEITYKLEN